MKVVHYSIVLIGLTWFFGTNNVQADETAGDLDVTIEVVEDGDDIDSMINKLSLPDSASDRARERAENREGKGLSNANDMHMRNDLRKQEHMDEVADRKESHADQNHDRGNASGHENNGMGHGSGNKNK